jgi:hypothetical protein
VTTIHMTLRNTQSDLRRHRGSRVVHIGNRGHINANSGLGAWPEGYELLNQLRGEPIVSKTAAAAASPACRAGVIGIAGWSIRVRVPLIAAFMSAVRVICVGAFSVILL